MSDKGQFSNEYLEEHTLQIGRVVLAAAMMDHVVSSFTAAFLDLSEVQENVMLRPMMARAKIDLLRTLTNHYLPRHSARKMAKAFDAAKTALEERNALIHGVPTHINGEVAFVSYTGKNRIPGEPELWPVERVCALATKFVDLGDLFETLLAGFLDHKSADGARREHDD